MNPELKAELKEIKSILAKLDKNYFADNSQVPPAYFDGMEDRFFNALKENNVPKESSSISIFNTKRFSYAIAAVAATAILSLSILTLIQSEKMPAISDNDVKTFLEEEGDFLALDQNTELGSMQKLKHLSNDEIKNYLCEVEGMDCEQIN